MPQTWNSSNVLAPKSQLNIIAPAVIKVGKGRIGKVLVSTRGSSGNFTMNDCASLAAATTENRIFDALSNEFTQGGQVLEFNWPFSIGLVVSSVTVGGFFTLTYA